MKSSICYDVCPHRTDMKSTLISIKFIVSIVLIIGVNHSNAQILDPTFNSTGIITSGLSGTTNSCGNVSVLSSGKILVGGTFTGSNPNIVAIRLNSDGTFDNSFGTSGTVIETLSNSGYITDGMYLDYNNNLIYTGSYATSSTQEGFFLSRLTSTGALDNSFGTNGLAQFTSPNYLKQIVSSDIQADNKITILVQSQKSDLSSDSFQVWRVNTNGTLDFSFGTNGIANVSYTVYETSAIKFLSTGKIITTGYDGSGNILVSRLNSNGSLDATFNGTGIMTFNVGYNDALPNTITIQKNGNILIAGKANSKFLVARVLSNGTLDNTFNSTGILILDFYGSTSVANTIAVDTFATINKIVVAGYTYQGGRQDMAIARIELSGIVEAKGDIPIGLTGDSEANSMSIQSDSKIVLAGNINNQTVSQDFAIVRILSNFSNNVTGVISPDLVSQNITLYPNPTSQNVTVNSTYNIQEIKVLDVLGNEVINQTANGNAQINVSTLPKGLYNFVITTDKGTGSKKVNVQ
jgi:uncharacterized delta-60 repeat protein